MFDSSHTLENPEAETDHFLPQAISTNIRLCTNYTYILKFIKIEKKMNDKCFFSCARSFFLLSLYPLPTWLWFVAPPLAARSAPSRVLTAPLSRWPQSARPILQSVCSLGFPPVCSPKCNISHLRNSLLIKELIH